MESEQMNEFRPLILVAEDDDSNFKLIKAIIGKKCDIEWAKNGQEMVELFQQHQERTKAMLMDIKMPVMNGLEATKIIRESNTEIPIIMQTAYAFSSDKENAMNAGARAMSTSRMIDWVSSLAQMWGAGVTESSFTACSPPSWAGWPGAVWPACCW